MNVGDLAADLALAADPALLFAKMGLQPDPWQSAILRSPARQIVLCCSRQAGKTTTIGAKVAHIAVYEPGSLIPWVCPSLRQSQEGFRAVKEAYTALGVTADAIEGESALRVEFTNGSRVVVLPGRSDATVRGYSKVRALILDEASRIPDELYRATRPMLAVSGGQLILASTPWGKLGFFHDVWANGGAEWERVRVTANQVSRISPAFLESERRSLPADVFAREYMCEFSDRASAVFSYDDVRAMVAADVEPLWPDLLLTQDAEPADLLFTTLEDEADYMEVPN